MRNDISSQWEGLLHAVQEGEQWAFQFFWDSYYHDLVRYTRKKIGPWPLRTVDEEDIAVSAMNSFFRGVSNKRFLIADNQEFWKLLTTMIIRKLQKQRQKQKARKRGQGNVRGESVFQQNIPDSSYPLGFGAFPSKGLTPDLYVEISETTEKLFEMLSDDGMRQVAQLLLEGNSINEIAEELGCVRRTVERKIERIRTIWGQEINDAE